MFVRFAHIRVRRVRDNADRITENITSGTKVFVWQECHSPLGVSRAKKDVSYFLLHWK
jgi:hypothetical protein